MDETGIPGCVVGSTPCEQQSGLITGRETESYLGATGGGH
jgi:hypothetical protein